MYINKLYFREQIDSKTFLLKFIKYSINMQDIYIISCKSSKRNLFHPLHYDLSISSWTLKLNKRIITDLIVKRSLYFGPIIPV